MGTEFVPADFRQPSALATAFAGADAILHLVGIISEYRTQTFEEAHVATTARVVEGARTAGVRRFIHMSALGTRPEAPSRYHRTKWAAERLVGASGLDWTLMRPSVVYGPEDQFTNLFARMASWSPVLPVMGSGTCLLQPVSVENVAQAFVGALSTPAAIGRCLDLCGPERMTLPALLQAILEAQGRKRWLLRVPRSLARGQAALLEWIFPHLLASPPPLNRDQLLMLDEDNVGDGTEADRLFGLVHRPLVDALRGQFARSLMPAPGSR